jgi:pyrroloquinoline quinone (PQQ) biosynthesis protein C
MTTFFQTLERETRRDRERLLNAPLVQEALSGQLNVSQYIAFLRQAYHHVRHTTPLLMALGARISQTHPWLMSAVAEYIEEEIGHEQWILNDIAVAGGDPLAAAEAKPALATEAMVAYAYYLIDRDNPIGFFGMVHVLEGTSVRVASEAANRISESTGLPPDAFTYLQSHGALDLEHVGHFEGLVNSLRREEDRQAVLRGARHFYAMYRAVFDAVLAPEEQLIEA